MEINLVIYRIWFIIGTVVVNHKQADTSHYKIKL